ncbi:aspartate/glutamate racemase family protein [Candidatus Bathyarchaeota archaeon]|nr:aspartate/glutamate racemase family protein [Candidatus Bathyarchaeota archaeon]
MYKKIGILGGLTPESTVTYYMHIVHRYHELHGDHGYPECIVYGVSFQRYEDWMEAEDWDSIEKELLKGLKALKRAGADFAVIATNTMHILFDKLQRQIDMPLISILDATGEAVKEAGLSKVGLIGTRFTMGKPFYREGLERQGIDVLVPGKEDRAYIQKVIFEELSIGKLTDESRRGYLKIIDKLVAQGAEGVVLGCTEIPLLVRQSDTDVKVFDTAVVHAEKALRYATEN